MSPEQVLQRFQGTFSNDNDIQQLIADLEADPERMISWNEREDSWLTFHASYKPANTRTQVVQER